MSGSLRVMVVVCMLAGCRQLFGIDSTDVARDGAIADDDARGDDGPRSDGPPPGIDAAVCYGTGYEQVCLAAAPTGPVMLAGTAINTDDAAGCASVVTASTPACVIAGTTVAVSGTVRATGTRPLVLIAAGDLSIGFAATLDVASRRGMPPGAGANASACSLQREATISGGGAGGSYGAQGGRGGNGANGGVEGIAGPTAPINSLRGGCPGGAGGNSSADQAGAGGGAVYLIAAGTISVQGTINASGGGGRGGLAPSRGGSGGGSGGQIAFDAPTISIEISASVYANGGGGGEAAGSGSTGNDGEEPMLPSLAANGGFGTNDNAGDGGNGGYRTFDAEQGGNGASSGGGGGGGGGVGAIKIFGAATISGSVSPTPQ